MNNLFGNLKMDMVFDLKGIHHYLINIKRCDYKNLILKNKIIKIKKIIGSKVGRFAKENETILKDNDIIEKKIKLNLHNIDENLYLNQISNDSKFLEKLNVMDYSLLLGI